MEAHVNENCIGCGLCPSICPEVFQMSDAGVAVAADDIPDGMSEMVHEAANSCPVSAIEVGD